MIVSGTVFFVKLQFMNNQSPIKRALISVSDKSGVVAFAKALAEMGVEIISTGGTARKLKDAGIEVISISNVTKFPEMMNGRVKTLHPRVHGALLAVRDNDDHMREAMDNEIKMIDLVVVNLYPFEETIAREDVTEAEAIENIDIGGPSMIRSAAKNFKSVTVVTNPDDYEVVLAEMKANGGATTLKTRKLLAAKSFAKTAHYDEAIAGYFRNITEQPELLGLHYQKVRTLRYGENPHQKAAFFRNPENTDANVTNAEVLQGKQLSFNNIVDADAALELVKEFDRPTAIFVKHCNPCGVASADTLEEAFDHGYKVDSLSAFGCVIALNRPCTKAIAEYVKEHKMFVEIIIAPAFEADALAILSERKNLRLLATGELKRDEARRDIKKVAGGILIQSADTYIVKKADLNVVSAAQPNDQDLDAMLFARKIVKHVKSNAVVFAKKIAGNVEVATGIGAGQMSRVDSVIIAKRKGGAKVEGSVMASDAFFPFPDGVEQAHEAGITAIIQPGGSIRDEEVIKRVDQLGMSMVFTGVRSFKH